MNGKNYRTLIALLLIAAMSIFIFTACGKKDTADEQSESLVESQDTETDIVEPDNDVTIDNDSGPKEVAAIDLNTTYEEKGTYYDENEGYDREYTNEVTEAIKYIDHKVFPSSEDNSCAVVIHFKETVDYKYYDAKGNEMPGSIPEDYLRMRMNWTHEVTNIDTGEIETVDDTYNIYYDSSTGETSGGSYGKYDGLIEYLNEVGYIKDEWGSEGVQAEKRVDADKYVAIELGTTKKGVIKIKAWNSAINEKRVNVKSYNDTEQIMTIELE